jgi:hypothetical protein
MLQGINAPAADHVTLCTLANQLGDAIGEHWISPNNFSLHRRFLLLCGLLDRNQSDDQMTMP